MYAHVYVEDDGVESATAPQDGVKAGLLDGAGQQLPLQAVHVKAKLMDLLSQVNGATGTVEPGARRQHT